MSRFGRHFVRTKEIKAFENRFGRLLLERPGTLNEKDAAMFRYALAYAQMNLFRTPEGNDVELSEAVDPVRRWILEAVVNLIPESGEPNVSMLRQIAPVLALRVDQSRTELLARFVNDFSAEHLDRELGHKELVLVLGGGGGGGLNHLGTFSLLSELDITPELIVGSSMGSMMGVIRAMDRVYDPVATALSLPKQFDYNTVFKPFTGYSRYGFPGAFHLNLLRAAREVFDALFGVGHPRFSDLPIKLEIVASGIRTGFQLDDDQYRQFAEKDSGGSEASAVRKRLRLFFSAVRQLTKNPRFLTQVVFGQGHTERFPVIEAAGFSCAVPGLLHYDVFHDDPETIEPLDQIFEEQSLLRLCDGGVVNNVPSRVAWESVQGGSIGTRNAYIMSFDVFAPIASGRNMIWIPIQQIAKPAVVANLPYSDHHKTFQRTPSPLQIIVNSYSKLKEIVDDAREQLEPDVPVMKAALEPLPPYGVWLS